MKGVCWYIYNFIHHEASPLPSPATYPYDTTMLLPFYISKSHLVISLQQFENSPDLQSTDANLEEWMNSFFFFYYSFFFSPHKSFSSKSKVLCLIIDEWKNKHGKKKIKNINLKTRSVSPLPLRHQGRVEEEGDDRVCGAKELDFLFKTNWRKLMQRMAFGGREGQRRESREDFRVGSYGFDFQNYGKNFEFQLFILV